MRSAQELESLFKELLSRGLEIESGKQRFLLATPETLAKLRSGKQKPLVLKAVRLGAVRAPIRPRKGRRAVLKVEPEKILTVLGHAEDGLRMRDIAARLKVPWQGLIASLRHLKQRHRVREANGFYFLTAAGKTALETLDAGDSSDKSCTFEKCRRAHYAKGLCNNHYNIERRRAAAALDFDPDEDLRRRKAYRLTILNALREQRDGITLFALGKVVNEKWQTLRQPASELVRERLVAKRGKLYVPVADDLEDEERL